MDVHYSLPESSVYRKEIRKIQDSDPVSASGIVNPLIEAVLENIHFVKLRLDALAAGAGRHVVAARPRAAGKPNYGLDGSVALETGPYTGTAAVAVAVSGVLYDAKNLGFDGESNPDGTILMKTEENKNG